MISIIVPVYKIEKYLDKCIESIVSQTYKELEIILVDDGSPDNCPQMCDEWAKKDGRIKVVHKSNGGLMSARQAGLKAATGDYVGFVDGDDWIDLDMYASFAAAASEYSPDMIICEFKFVYPDETIVSEQKFNKEYYDKNALLTEVYPTMLYDGSYYKFGVYPCCWSKLFKRELLENNLYNVTTSVKMGEDAAFTYPCLLEAESVAYINKPLYNYRNIPESMSNAYDKNMADTIFIPYDILKKAFSKCDIAVKNQLGYYALYLLNIALRNEASKNNAESKKEKKETIKKLLASDISVACENVDLNTLPRHIKYIAHAVKEQSVFKLLSYVELRRLI